MIRSTCLSAICVTGWLCVPGAQAQSVDTAIAEQQRMHQGIQQSQAKVDQLDDKTRAMLEEYLRLGEEADGGQRGVRDARGQPHQGTCGAPGTVRRRLPRQHTG